MRKPLLAGNWKMNLTGREAADFLASFLPLAGEGYKKTELMIAPAFTALYAFNNTPEWLKLGAQNCYYEEKGAFTGEVSLPMLKDAGVAYVICGHSERRQYFGDTDEVVRKKVEAVFAAGLIPVLCVGETEAEREEGRMEEVLKTQLLAATENLTEEQAKTLVVAYEPVWAIGTGKAATAEDASSAMAFIRGLLREKFQAAADSTRLLYGGSVNETNVAEYLKDENIDGALVGGASLKADRFHALALAFENR